MALARSSPRPTLAEFVRTHQETWLRWAIVLGVPGMAAVLGQLASRRSPLLAVAIASSPLLLVCLQLLAQYWEWTPILILVVALFVPLSVPVRGSELVASLMLTTALAVIWVLRMMMVEKRFSLRPSPLNKPLGGFMLVAAWSLGWSIVLRDPLVRAWSSFPLVQLAATLVMIMLPVAFWMVANHIRGLKQLKAMAIIMLLAGALGLIKEFAWSGLPVNTRGMFAMWVINLSVALVLFNRRMHWGMRSLLALLTASWVYLGFGLRTYWLAGWLPGFVAIGVLSLMRSKKLALVVGCVLLIFILVNTNYLDTVIQTENQESGQTRLAAWEVNWAVTRAHLLFGTGPAGYAAYYMSYFPDRAMATHSNYIDMLSQTGIVGFVLFVWFFIVLAWRGYKLRIRLKGRGDFAEALANAAFAGVIAGIVIMGFGDWMIPFAYTQTIAGFDYAVYNWLFMGTIPVIDRLTQPGAAANA